MDRAASSDLVHYYSDHGRNARRRTIAMALIAGLLFAIALVVLPFDVHRNACGPPVASMWEREPEGRVVSGHLVRPPTACAQQAVARLRTAETIALVAGGGLATLAVTGRRRSRRFAPLSSPPAVGSA